MSRVPLVHVEDMTPEQRAQYDRFPSNLTRGLLLAEQKLAGVLPATANALRIAAIEVGDRSGRLGAFTSILAFVDECVADIRVSDATFAAVSSVHSPREIATMLILIGHYMTVARFITNLGIELDQAPSTWDKEH